MRKSKFGTKEIKILGLSHRGTLEFYDFIIFVFLQYIAIIFFKVSDFGFKYLWNLQLDI